MGSQVGDAVAALNAQAIAMGWGMRCYEALDFVRPELNAMHELWREKQQAVGWPGRADFDARTLKPYLSHVSIVERVAGERGGWRYRFRLTGTDLVRLFGETTGRFLDEIMPGPFVERWTAGYDAVLAGRAPLRFVSHFQQPRVNWLDGETFSAPLANGDAPPRMILGVTYTAPKPATGAAE